MPGAKKTKRFFEEPPYDRNIFILIILVGLAFGLNVRGLMTLFERAGWMGSWGRIAAVGVAIVSGGLVGLYSRRIACYLTEWRDRS